MWDNIEYFLERVVPVAEEAKVRIACHPNDPGMPDESFHGVPSVLSSVAGLKRFIDIHPSPYHGINLCQGTVCEMLAEPNREILDVIRYFGSRRKIFNVHFRNIKGKFLRFQEVFPDDGSVDMLACARAYRDVGYDGMLMPDHAPSIEGDRTGLAFAFELGYIQAAIQMVQQEARAAARPVPIAPSRPSHRCRPQSSRSSGSGRYHTPRSVPAVTIRCSSSSAECVDLRAARC
jgi:mannonate dehydratase